MQRPNSTASYLAILLLHLSIFAVNYKRASYHSLMTEGDIRIAVAPAPEAPQVLS
jgi:hypothetical protein